MSSLLEKEIEHQKSKGLLTSADENTQVDFILHWRMPLSSRWGCLSTFKQDLFTRQDNEASIEPVHVVFNYGKETLAEKLPVSIPLNLSITP